MNLAERPVTGAVDLSVPLLEVENLHVSYRTAMGRLPAVSGVSFACHPGDRIGIIGESGSGKTTLAIAVTRLTRPPAYIDGGRVLLRGKDILSLSKAQLRRTRLAEIAYVPQGSMNSLNPVMRVGRQMEDAIRAHEPGWSRAQIDDRIEYCLSRVGLPLSARDRYPHELSGGMRQRMVIAIATILNPSVIVADEPTSALDVVVQRQVIRTLLAVQRELNAVVLLIGHDMGLMAQFANRIAVMYAGELVEMGPSTEIVNAPRHPYTQALIATLPSLHERKAFVGLPGLPPSLSALPSGCKFHPRCSHAFAPCPSISPPVFRAGNHEAKCHLLTQPPPPDGPAHSAFDARVAS